MSKKPTGLSAFAVKRPDPVPSPAVATDAGIAEPPAPTTSTGKRGRGQGATVALTIRLSRGDWQRLHSLAIAEGTSLQVLGERGFSRLLEEQGLPGVGTP